MTDNEMYQMVSKSFITDWEKMRDFFVLSKPDFLQFYSYLTEEEYEATCKYWKWLTDIEYEELKKAIDILPKSKIFDAAMVLVKAALGRELKGA